MKKYKQNAGLLDSKRFQKQNREHKIWLKNLSYNEAITLEEKLISSYLIWEWRNNFIEDTPVCIKLGLRKKHENSVGRCI